MAKLDARPTGDQEVAGSTPAGSATVCSSLSVRILWANVVLYLFITVDIDTYNLCVLSCRYMPL